MQESDWPEVQRIYGEGIATGQATFGFRVVGRREKIARMAHGPAAGQWRDTVLIERRTQVL